MDASRAKTLVQPILVHYGDDSRAIDIIACAATASSYAVTRANLADCDQLDINADWYAVAMTKTVRRISKPSVWSKFIEDESKTYDDCVFIDIPHNTQNQRVHDHGAVAMPVVTYEDLAPIAKRAQVSGTELPYKIGDIARHYSLDASMPRADVFLDAEMGMSMGKLAAQASHAACVLARGHTIHPFNISYSMASHDEMNELSEVAAVKVHDNGLTEIEAGSLTALACINK